MLCQARSEDLVRRQVDAHPRRRAVTGPRPGRGFTARLVQHPAPDRHQLTRVLGDLQELDRCEQPALGMAPADQRLDPRQPLGGQLHDRLVVQLELAARERGAELQFQLGSCGRLASHRRLEEPHRALAVLLGRVHREVRRGDQLLRVVAAPGRRSRLRRWRRGATRRRRPAPSRRSRPAGARPPPPPPSAPARRPAAPRTRRLPGARPRRPAGCTWPGRVRPRTAARRRRRARRHR